MARKRVPRYGTVAIRGNIYYKTYIEDEDGKRSILYGRTREELYEKELAALDQLDYHRHCKRSPTLEEYAEKWLVMQSAQVRETTMIDYSSKVRRHIIHSLGKKRIAEITLDDIQLALVPVSKKSASVYKSVVTLYKQIFRAAMDSKVIEKIQRYI